MLSYITNLKFIASVHCGQKIVMMNRTLDDFITPFSRVLVLNISQLVPLGTGDEMEFKSWTILTLVSWSLAVIPWVTSQQRDQLPTLVRWYFDTLVVKVY